MDIGRDTFTLYTGELGNLRPEGMPPFSSFIYLFTAVGRPSLSKFYCDRIHRARLYVDRSFHSLVTFQRLARWGLGPKPSVEAIAHEVTVCRRKFLL